MVYYDYHIEESDESGLRMSLQEHAESNTTAHNKYIT